jgi:hypothetical protein
MSVVTNAVTSALNAYHLGAGHAISITNQMVAAVGHGKMTMQDLAASLAAVLPVAAKAHLSFAQVAGAIATMTAQGTSADEASQLLRHTIVSLQNPNSVQIAEMQQLGINSIAVAKNLGTDGLTGTIQGLEHSILTQMGPAGLVLLKSFNNSKLAAESAAAEIRAMPPALRTLADAYADGKIGANQWYEAVTKGNLPAIQANMLSQFAKNENVAKGFNSQLLAGGGDAQTFTAALSKVMGGAEGLQVALQVGGKSMPVFGANVRAIGRAGQHAGENIRNWAVIQREFNFQLGSAVKSFRAAGTILGLVLLPAVSEILRPISEFLDFISRSRAASILLATTVGTVLAIVLGTKLASAFTSVTSMANDFGQGVVALAGKMGILAAGESEVAAATDGATGAMVEFDAAADANPIGAIVLGIEAAIAVIAALVAGFVELYKHVKAVRDIVHDAGNALADGWKEATHLAGGAIKEFQNGALKSLQESTGKFEDWWHDHQQQISADASTTWSDIKTEVTAAWTMTWADIKSVFDIGIALWHECWAITTGIVEITWAVISNTIKTTFDVIADMLRADEAVMTGDWSAAGRDLESATVSIWHDIVSTLRSVTSDFGSMLYTAGQDLLHGLMNGMNSMIGGLIADVESIGSNVVSAMMHAVDAHSPSRKFYQIGVWIDEGLRLGIAEHADQVREEAHKLAVDVSRALSAGLITGSEATSLDNRITEALDRALRDLKARRAQYVKDLHELGLQMQDGLLKGLTSRSTSTINDSVKSLLDVVNEAFDDNAISAQRSTWLTKWLEGDNNKLEQLADQRNALLTRIASARSYASQTAANVESWAGIANVASAIPSGGAVTGGALLAGLQQNLATIRQFNTALRRLTRLGLDRNLLNQIIQAGPVQGLQMALALLDGPISQIKQLNATQTAINQASTLLGQTGADAMYNVGEATGKGFLRGIEDQRKAIENLMAEIAKNMIKVLRKELGISSPSRVAHQHGFDFMRGLVEGILAGRPMLNAAMHQVTGDMMFRPGSLTAGGGTGGGVVINAPITVNVPGGFVGSNQELATALAHEIQPVLLQLARRNPVRQY